MNVRSSSRFVFLASSLLVLSMGCVSQSLYNEVSQSREALAAELEKVRIERDSLENQYYEAQESYEDERLTRTSLANNLEQTTRHVSELDQSLSAERDARIAFFHLVQSRTA